MSQQADRKRTGFRAEALWFRTVKCYNKIVENFNICYLNLFTTEDYAIQYLIGAASRI